jgi:hypothetical protein
MRRRKLLVALAVLAAVVAAGVVVWPRPLRATRENYDRIQVGMSRAEVEAILGPPGDYRTVLTQDMSRPCLQTDREAWVVHEGHVVVWYAHGVVSSWALFPAVAVEQTPLENLLWRAKRQWHRWFPVVLSRAGGH